MPSSQTPSLRLTLIIVALLFGGSCDSASSSSSADGGSDPPCSCATGDRRCQGTSVQICEVVSAGCSSWGAAVACPTNMCANGSCGGNCTDACPGGTARCTSDVASEICRIGSSGCLQWASQSCAAQQYCDFAQNSCVASVPCSEACPSSYMCKTTGVCAGGDPSMVGLDVKTVQLAGKVTLNGADPVRAGTGCSDYAGESKAIVRLTDATKGYSFALGIPCSSTGFAFTGAIYPGTYRVTVEGRSYGGDIFSNVPTQPYVIDLAFVVAADVSGKTLNVQTVQLAGKVTLNGADPVKAGTGCSDYAGESKAIVRLTDATKGYSFALGIPCSAPGFAFTGAIYPGTYRVTVEGRSYGGDIFSNLPTQPYVIDLAFAVAADVSGKTLNVQTVQFAGKVTLNGADPVRAGTGCSDYAGESKAIVRLTDSTKGYSFALGIPCSPTGFAFTGAIYPGTYRVTVEGRSYGGDIFSNVPTQPYVIDLAFVVAADVSGKTLNVQTVQLAGKVTLNGADPVKAGTGCSDYAGESKAVVRLTDATKGYSFALGIPCAAPDFAFTGAIYPGTYRVTVEGRSYGGDIFSNVPTQPYVIDLAFVVAADVSGKTLNVQTVQLAGKVTLNGADPVRAGTGCSDYAGESKAIVRLTDSTKGYSFALGIPCSSTGFAFTGAIYPGTYRVTVEGRSYGGDIFSNLPTQPYVIDLAFVVAADVSGKTLNVQTVQLAGKVTLNGADPVKAGTGCSDYAGESKAIVRLTDASKGYAFALGIPCAAPGFTFTGAIYPGTYRVTVEGRSYGGDIFSNLPTQPYVVVSRFQIP